MATRLNPCCWIHLFHSVTRSGSMTWVRKVYVRCFSVSFFAEDCVRKTGTLSCSARSWTASVTELWNCPTTATTRSWLTSFRRPAAPFSGVPASSSTMSSILRPPRTPPCPLISSVAILAPRTMNCPAAASPGGESGVSTPILMGAWAKAGTASVAAATAASRKVLGALSMVTVLQYGIVGLTGSASYAGGLVAVKVSSSAREALDEPEVGGREPVARQHRCLDPEHLLPLLRAGLALHGAAEEEDPHGFLRIDPSDCLDQLAYRRFYSELLLHLAPERILRLLRGQDLATRKLPEAGQVRALEPAGDEIAAASLDDRRDDLDGVGHRALGRGPAAVYRDHRAGDIA